uniref:Ribosomal RNA processing 1B n=1 Tax=Astyanax mexicanus TaxID=7994 RepID=A0A3B1ITS5_ASTMX
CAPSQPEVAVAQRLASNERPVRTRALKTLKKYINLRSQTGGFCRDDLLKIWKGLFYSLWMQDKPDLQEELSDRVSLLIHSFHTFNNQLLYFETFLQTMKREWNGIDRLRMDKFFQLVRFVFRQVFEVLKRKAHASVLFSLCCFLCFSRSVLSSVCKHIFSTILDHASYAVEELMKELSDGGEDSGAAEEESEEEEETGRRSLKKDDSDDDVGPVLQFDYGALADCLFELGSRPLTPNFNRNKIYKLVKTEQECSVRKKGKGKIRKCLDAELLEEEDSGSLQTSAPPSVRKKSGKKSKKIQEEGLSPDCSNQTLTDVQQENDLSVSSPVMKKKKKQKQKSATNDEEVVIISETGPDVEILEIQDSNVPSFSETTTFTKKRREGAVSKKKKIKAKDDIEIITIPEDSNAVSPTPKKRKNKKQKAKELAAQISEPAEEAVEEPEVAADYKPTGKGHTRTAEEEEAAVPVQTPTRKKKSQKKHKQQLLELTEDVKEEVQLPDLSEEPVQKKSRKQKQKTEAAAEATEAAVESTTLRKTKKKRKIQADEAETSQINGKAGTEVGGTEISSINTQTVVNIYLFVLEFRTTDQSLLVSPVGSSRVAFDPEKKPASGVLKSPSASPFTSLKKATPKKRPTAADFF